MKLRNRFMIIGITICIFVGFPKAYTNQTLKVSPEIFGLQNNGISVNLKIIVASKAANSPEIQAIVTVKNLTDKPLYLTATNGKWFTFGVVEENGIQLIMPNEPEGAIGIMTNTLEGGKSATFKVQISPELFLKFAGHDIVAVLWPYNVPKDSPTISNKLFLKLPQ